MKSGVYQNECELINGVTISDMEEHVHRRLVYPEFRVLMTTVDKEFKLIIEVHVKELGDGSDFFGCATEAKNLSEDNFESLLNPMIDRINADIKHELAA